MLPFKGRLKSSTHPQNTSWVLNVDLERGTQKGLRFKVLCLKAVPWLCRIDKSSQKLIQKRHTKAVNQNNQCCVSSRVCSFAWQLCPPRSDATKSLRLRRSYRRRRRDQIASREVYPGPYARVSHLWARDPLPSFIELLQIRIQFRGRSNSHPAHTDVSILLHRFQFVFLMQGHFSFFVLAAAISCSF